MRRNDPNASEEKRTKLEDAWFAMIKQTVEKISDIYESIQGRQGAPIKSIFRKPTHRDEVKSILKELSEADPKSPDYKSRGNAYAPGDRAMCVLLNHFNSMTNEVMGKEKPKGGTKGVAEKINELPSKHHFTRLLGVALSQLDTVYRDVKQDSKVTLFSYDAVSSRSTNRNTLTLAKNLQIETLSDKHQQLYNQVNTVIEAGEKDLKEIVNPSSAPRQDV